MALPAPAGALCKRQWEKSAWRFLRWAWAQLQASVPDVAGAEKKSWTLTLPGPKLAVRHRSLLSRSRDHLFVGWRS